MSSNKGFLILITLLLSGLSVTSLAQVKITDGVDQTMNENSLLELESVNKGLLIPRVALDDLNQPDPLTVSVPIGMLVYSTGGLVPDGFYYWNESKWVYFNVSETLATKSADATLLKSETFVLASGDTKLTLPLVTSADNGLSITVKNIGTHLNLITIEGNSGATIDGLAETSLTRWRGQTYVAWEGNWNTRNRETQTDNLLDVSRNGSFTTISEVIEFLKLHMSGPTVVRLSDEIQEIDATQTINLPYPVTFQGLSFGETEIDATAGVSGSPLFDCKTECYFKMLTFNSVSNAPGNDAIHLTGSETYYEVKDAYFVGFNKGIVSTTNTDLWVFEVDFEDCTGAGIEVAAGVASGGSLKISESDFIQCGNGIHLLSGASETVSILNCTFYNTVSGSDIGVLYTPATFISFNSIFITNNAWNNQGTFFSGFDFTRSDGRDANVFLSNNAGAENKNPYVRINVNNNISTTTVTTAGTFYKANWTNTSNYTTKWTVANNGSFVNYNSTIAFSGNTQLLNGTTPVSYNNIIVDPGSTTTITTPGQSLSGILLCNGTFNANGNLTLLSSDSQTALIDGSGTGEVNGNVTIQRYLSSGFGYKYLSSPFQAATVSEFSDNMKLADPFPAFYRYDESSTTSGWVTYIDPVVIYFDEKATDKFDTLPAAEGTLIISNLTGQISLIKKYYEPGYYELNHGLKNGVYIVVSFPEQGGPQKRYSYRIHEFCIEQGLCHPGFSILLKASC